MRLIALLLTLVASVWVGLRIVDDPGLIYFVYKQYSVEMPLWLGGLILIVVFFSVYALIRLIIKLFYLPKQVHIWHQNYKIRQTYQRFAQGLIALNQGEWGKAEQKFLQASPQDKQIAMINYLNAAKAAHAKGDQAACNLHLKKAEQANPNQVVSIQLYRAQFQYERGDLSEALVTLEALKQKHPRNTQVLRLLKDVYLKMNNWEQVSQLLPRLRRHNLVSKTEYEALQVNASGALLTNCNTVEVLVKNWKKTAYRMQTHPMVLAKYAARLIQLQAHCEAEASLYRSLRKQYDEELMHYYGLCQTKNPAKHLAHAEKIAQNTKPDPTLYLTLGRLAKQNKLWGKARNYFEKSLNHTVLPETCQELAALLDALGETELARQYYRQGLQHSISATTVLKLENMQQK
jgi:HemY protein